MTDQLEIPKGSLGLLLPAQLSTDKALAPGPNYRGDTAPFIRNSFDGLLSMAIHNYLVKQYCHRPVLASDGPFISLDTRPSPNLECPGNARSRSQNRIRCVDWGKIWLNETGKSRDTSYLIPRLGSEKRSKGGYVVNAAIKNVTTLVGRISPPLGD